MSTQGYCAHSVCSHRTCWKIRATVAVQIIAWAAWALLETLVGGHQLSFWLAIQVLWPIVLTLDATQPSLTIPRHRRIAPIINGLYAIMLGTGIIANGMAAFHAPSALVFGRLTLAVILTATYLLSAWLLGPLLRRTVPAA
jgi:hypothetical protein